MGTRRLFSLPRFAAFAVLLFAAPAEASVAAPEIYGQVTARGSWVRGQESWLAGGFGRLAAGGDDPEDSVSQASGEARLALDWQVSHWFRIFLHGGGRLEEDSRTSADGGLIEAYLEGYFDNVGAGRLRLRAGQFFLPTSFENVEPLWSSPYTLSLSALNTWIGEEIRPAGLDADYRWETGGGDRLSLGGTVFGGNDASGALLAWRGWSLGNRLSYYGEVLPLPPLASLADPAVLGEQRDDGTRPFGDDLDGRPGWSGRLRWDRPERFRFQVTWIDTRGDRDLHQGEYAWDTQLGLAGFEITPNPFLTLAGEYASGSTGMGPVDGPATDLDFRSGYLLASISWSTTWRLSARFDHFETEEQDFSIAETNDEDGKAWTVALLWQPRPSLRLGLEILGLDSDRPAAAESGFDADTDAESVSFEVQLTF